MSEINTSGLVSRLLLQAGKAPADYYFPVNVDLAQNLLGKLLTHIEAMNLPEKAEKANKDLMRQSFWRWWADVKDNSLTSYRGCVAPIEVVRDPSNSTESAYRWLGGGASEEHIVSVVNDIDGRTGTVLEGVISQIGPGTHFTNIANSR